MLINFEGERVCLAPSNQFIAINYEIKQYIATVVVAIADFFFLVVFVFLCCLRSEWEGGWMSEGVWVTQSEWVYVYECIVFFFCLVLNRHWRLLEICWSKIDTSHSSSNRVYLLSSVKSLTGYCPFPLGLHQKVWKGKTLLASRFKTKQLLLFVILLMLYIYYYYYLQKLLTSSALQLTDVWPNTVWIGLD